MKKIILGEKKFIGNQNEDIFLDVELSREIETLKIDSLENVFDYQNQFIKERNSSFKFCLYGTVESRYGHCDNLALNIYVKDTKPNQQNDKTIIYTPYKHNHAMSGTDFTVLSKPLSDNSLLSKNIYGTNKGCYFFYFEILKENLEQGKSIFVEIFDQANELYGKFSIPFIFFDTDGELIEFGTETSDFNEENEIETINNNFPFFYDKHWIKFNIEPNGPMVVSFDNATMNIKENEFSNVTIPISLDKPSEYGHERAKIIVDLGFDEYGNKYTTANFLSDFNFNEQILEWSIGEKTKYVTINILNDLFVENIETIQLRIVPILNTRVDINTNNSMVLYIESEDVPSSIYFGSGQLEIQRPLFSSNISSPDLLNLYSSYLSIPSVNNIKLNLSSEILIPGEKIKVKFLPNESTGKITGNIYGDFVLDPNNTTAFERILDIPQNLTSFTFDVLVKSHPGYVLDKTIVLQLEQETIGVVPTSQSNTNTLPKITLILKDSTLYQYTKYIIPVNNNKNLGLYKTIYYNSSGLNNRTILSKNIINPAGLPSVSQTNVTNHFTCDLVIKNLGQTIIWDGQTIEPYHSFKINIDAFALNSNFEINLPANTIWQGNNYANTYYDFKFENFQKTYPSSVSTASSVYDIYNKFDQSVEKEVQKAGVLDKEKRYLQSEVYKAISTYDEDTETCGLIPEFENDNDKILYGSVLFTGYGNGTYKTRTNLLFSKDLVSTKCAKVNDSLPVGTDLIRQGPYLEQTAILYLGSIFSQINYDINNANKEMFIYAVNNNNFINDSYKFFNPWNLMSVDSQNALELEIFNNGVRDVTVLNKVISPNESQKYYYPEVDFSNIILNVKTNDDHEYMLNGFKKFNYTFKINNIKIPHQMLNNTTFETINSIILGEYTEQLPILTASQTTRIRFLQSRYNSVKIFSNVTGNNIYCNATTNNPWSTKKDIITNDILLFANTGSVFIGSEWKSQEITSTCPNSLISFKII